MKVLLQCEDETEVQCYTAPPAGGAPRNLYFASHGVRVFCQWKMGTKSLSLNEIFA